MSRLRNRSVWALAVFLIPATISAQQGTGLRIQSKPAAGDDKAVVAYVNGVPITRQELAEELIARRGKEQLELLINRRIIDHACQKAGIKVTDAEVEQELDDVIKTVGAASASDFEEKILKDRRSSLLEYKSDVIRPGIAMRKLAGNRIKVTEEDVQKAFEANFGEKVRCRAIMLSDMKTALRIHPEVKKDREAFLRHAANQQNTTLSATGGTIRISRHSMLEGLEKEAFRLRDGEVSSVLQVPPQGFVILLREALEPADTTKKLVDVRESLEKSIMEKKLQVELPKVFKEVKDQATIRDYLNNKHELPKSAQAPKPADGREPAAGKRETGGIKIQQTGFQK